MLYRKELESAKDPAAERAKRVAEFREKFANPFIAAANGFVDEVIQPRTTRRKLIMALATLTTKREKNPPKKHGKFRSDSAQAPDSGGNRKPAPKPIRALRKFAQMIELQTRCYTF